MARTSRKLKKLTADINYLMRKYLLVRQNIVCKVEELRDELGAYTRNYFFKRLSNQNDADDCWQELWARVLESLLNCKYDPNRGRIMSYILGIAEHIFVQWIQPPPPVGGNGPETLSPEQITEIKELRSATYKSLWELKLENSNWFDAVIMNHCQGLPMRDAADVLGISAGAFSDHKNKGLDKIRMKLKSKGFDDQQTEEAIKGAKGNIAFEALF